ncbi:hypothetical protein [Aeoliella sp. SH292]|uniref:hypothetical protein n=1 Tax=Aeoliella sp. SH292 TaxID=3454464 RepID=UPI003F9EA8C6
MSDMRAENGRFQAGNPGGPGRPPKGPPSRYLVAMEETITDSEWKRLVRVTYERALKGDHRAREWLAKYLVVGGGRSNRAGQLAPNNQEPCDA